MKLIALSVLLSLVHGCFSDVYSINDDIDRGLKIANKHATRLGKGFIPFPQLSYGNITMSNGGLVGANSLRRTGEATLSTHEEDSNMWTVDLHVGQRVYYLVFGTIQVDGEEMSGVFRVSNHSFHLSYSVRNESATCRLLLHQYRYELMAPASFEASEPGFSGNVSGFFTNVVLPTINKKVDFARGKIQEALEKVVCKNPHHQANNYEDILIAAFFHGDKKRGSRVPGQRFKSHIRRHKPAHNEVTKRRARHCAK